MCGVRSNHDNPLLAILQIHKAPQPATHRPAGDVPRRSPLPARRQPPLRNWRRPLRPTDPTGPRPCPAWVPPSLCPNLVPGYPHRTLLRSLLAMALAETGSIRGWATVCDDLHLPTPPGRPFGLRRTELEARTGYRSPMGAQLGRSPFSWMPGPTALWLPTPVRQAPGPGSQCCLGGCNKSSRGVRRLLLSPTGTLLASGADDRVGSVVGPDFRWRGGAVSNRPHHGDAGVPLPDRRTLLATGGAAYGGLSSCRSLRPAPHKTPHMVSTGRSFLLIGRIHLPREYACG